MKVNEFIEKLKEALEIESSNVSTESVLRDLDNYDSMAVLAIIALVDEHFNKQLTAEQFRSITTLQSLIDIIGADKFEN